jgi:penicillin-binding protein 1A
MDTTGGVVSMIGGNDYRESSFNRATKALRQPGSSFKPYVYAAAVDAGILDKDTVVTDRPTCVGRWCPHNYNGSYSGSMPAWQAMAQSINSIPVQLSIQLGKENSSVKSGRDKIVNMAYKMGVRSELYDSQSLPIGSVEVTPLDQAVGYTSLANGGYRVRPYSIKEVRNSSGDVIYVTEPEMEKLLSERVVSNLNYMLNKVVDQGTAASVRMPDYTIAGKTGTTNAYKDAWFVGYTGSLTAAIWMGNDDNSSSEKMTGGSLPARTWKLVMEEALKTYPNRPPPFLTLAVNPATNKSKKATPTPPTTATGPKQFEPPVVKERGFWQKLFNLDD